MQDKLGVTPSYAVLSESGPDHDKVFVVGVFTGSRKVARALGRQSKRQRFRQQRTRSSRTIFRHAPET